MFAIDDVLLSDDILSAQFVCDLNACKGACCVDGDAGAPLEEEELVILDKIVEKVKPYLPADGLKEINEQGNYIYSKVYGWVTPTIGTGICAYGYTDKKGIVKCGIEQAFLDGKINFKKPVSCHLFPITVDRSKKSETLYANYEPRDVACKPACKLGKKLKVPVYEFLKEPLVRRFGEEFYEAIVATAAHYKQNAENEE